MRQREKAYQANRSNILSMLDQNIKAEFLDLGCDDGIWTLKMAQAIGTDKTYGLEIVKEAGDKAKKRGITVSTGNLNDTFPFKDGTFDVVNASQVVEHIADTDKFMDEIYRILKPGGYAVLSTENLASWHNIVALLLGYMPFSLTNISGKSAAIGNPAAPHAGKESTMESSWQHQRVFTIQGLKHLAELTGFKVEKVLTSGYYPLGDFFSRIDPRHSHFFVVKLRR